MKPYYSDDRVELYLGDFRSVLPDLEADCVIADPPYGETSILWDVWPDGWPGAIAHYAPSMWCFGSMRMFLDRSREFSAWKLSQDVVWEKEHGSGPQADRFKRVHEHALHWYQGKWAERYHAPPRVAYEGPDSRHGYGPRAIETHHLGQMGQHQWVDDGTRIMRSVIKHPSMWRRGAINPTEKPVELLIPLIEYASPVGGLVIDPFAGSASTLIAARQSGRRAVGVEVREEQCEKAAIRLSQSTLDFAGGAA